MLTAFILVLSFCNCATLITIEVSVGVEENCNLEYSFLFTKKFNVG